MLILAKCDLFFRQAAKVNASIPHGCIAFNDAALIFPYPLASVSRELLNKH